MERGLAYILIVLITAASVSSLCSTCTVGQCHDNGECIIGCVPGYVGEYCHVRCPKNCLHNLCHIHIASGTVTCSDGCVPGYCGTKCTLSCPKGCTTCDRQCDSCNKTLCPEGLYGPDCTDRCNPVCGKCDRETGECIRCRPGYYGDQCNHQCRDCFTIDDTIAYTCLSGCEVCQSQESCDTGFHGIRCKNRCGEGCVHRCNKATGECSSDCKPGYYGLNCNQNCSEHCLGRTCDRVTAECTFGCESGYYGLSCNYTCSSGCLGGICHQYTGICAVGCIEGYQTIFGICQKDETEAPGHSSITIKVLAVVVGMTTLASLLLLWKLCEERKAQTKRSSQDELTHVAEKKET